MVTLDGVTDVNLLSSDGNVISWGKETPITISVDVPMEEEVKTMGANGANNSFGIASDNCIFDARTVDYLCGLLSPAEYKMPKKKHRKKIRNRKRFKKIRRIILGKYYKTRNK